MKVMEMVDQGHYDHQPEVVMVVKTLVWVVEEVWGDCQVEVGVEVVPLVGKDHQLKVVVMTRSLVQVVEVVG